MSRSIFKPLALALGISLGASAGAATITDTVTQNEYVGVFGQHRYIHNLYDDGLVLGTATSGSLRITIADDRDTGLERALPEIRIVIVDSFDFDSGGITLGDFNKSLGIQALGSLNEDGKLNVTVRSLAGDFYVRDSVLTVEGQVPAPGTLGLLGGALAMLGLFRRKFVR